MEEEEGKSVSIESVDFRCCCLNMSLLLSLLCKLLFESKVGGVFV